MSENANAAVHEIEEMYVHSAGAATFGDSTLTLRNISPAVLFFADRPDREVGHITSEEFVSQWETRA